VNSKGYHFSIRCFPVATILAKSVEMNGASDADSTNSTG
jgi:hypothetical protein